MASTFTIHLVFLRRTATLPYRERGQAVRGPESTTPSSPPSHNMIYAPECLEDEFRELRQNRILRSSQPSPALLLPVGGLATVRYNPRGASPPLVLVPHPPQTGLFLCLEIPNAARAGTSL